MAGLLYGLKVIHQSAADDRAHTVGFKTARTTAHDLLFDIWNAETSAGRKACVDLDGKFYSAALTAGDVLYCVAGGVTGVKRLDSLAIGTVGKIMRSDGSAPTWTTLTIPDTATTGDILHASATNVYSSLAKGTARQVLQMNAGATLPEWTSTLLLTGVILGPSGAAGAPTYSFSTDTDTGMYLLTPGILALSVGGSPILTLNAGAEISVLGTGVRLTLMGSTTSRASLLMPHGTAPTSPTNGELWTTTAGLYVRINGATVGPLS